MKNNFELPLDANDLDQRAGELDQMIKSFENALEGLTSQERQGLKNVSDGNQTFAARIQSVIMKYPQFVPSYIDRDKFAESYVLHQKFKNYHDHLERFYETVRDTYLILGDRIMEDTHAVYRQVREANRHNEPEARSLYSQLKVRFTNTSIGRDKARGQTDDAPPGLNTANGSAEMGQPNPNGPVNPDGTQ